MKIFFTCSLSLSMVRRTMPSKRSNGGGRPLNLLERRVASCRNNNKNLSTVEDIAEHLRSTVPEYRRVKLAVLTMQVRKIQSVSTTNSKPPRLVFETDEEDDEDELEIERSSRKKSRRGGGGGGYEKDDNSLQRIEDEHIRKRQSNNHDSSSSSASSSESSEEEEGVSTSEDAVYSEKLEEPEFDVTRATLRKNYTPKKLNEKEKEKNIEIEIASEKKRVSSVDMMNSQGVKLNSNKENISSGETRKGESVEEETGTMFKDLGGMENVIEELKMEVIVPLYHPELPRWLGVKPMSGILLHGPPGCGKTKLAHAIANETGIPFFKISATELVSGVSGASEENIRDIFSKAYRTTPSIVFIDEIDAIASKRENLQREMERRIVTQLMTCMDESHAPAQEGNSNNKPGHVLVIGATNRPDAIDPALRRPGRFDREISLGVPDEKARIQILSVLTRKLRLEGSFDLVKLARSTPGFVGADLTALANKAGNLAMRRIFDQRKTELSGEPVDAEHSEDWWKKPWLQEEVEKLTITMADFEVAAKMVQPSTRREGFSDIPNVKWDDVGGLEYLRQEFERYIIRRIKNPEDYEGIGVNLESGFLLYGPPGCGKTLIAKAVAHESGATFIHIKGPELLNKYVGEGEAAVRNLFVRARRSSPCILFFDEVDALTTNRGKEGGWVVERILNTLLIELDGAEKREAVYIIGATNRPEVMDHALLRPGRFGKLLYVPLPNPDERGHILKALGMKKRIDETLDLNDIAKMEGCQNFSGADLAALINEAAMASLDDKLNSIETQPSAGPCTIKAIHFERALTKVSRSVSDKQIKYYEHLKNNFKSA